MSEELREEKQIAISWSDYQQHGCPNCGCASSHGSGAQGGGTIPSQCLECGSQFVILSYGLKKSTIGFSEGQSDDKKDILYYPLLVKHPREAISKHEYVNQKKGEHYSPKGLRSDLTSFVKSPEAKQRVIEMYQEIFREFEDKSKLIDLFGTSEFSELLDYASEESIAIQVKTNGGNKRRMYVLTRLISQNHSIITKEIVYKALNMRWTLLNIWKYEGKKVIYDMFDFSTIKSIVSQVEDISHEYSSIKAIKNISMQNKFLYYGTFIDVSKCIESYDDKCKNQFLLKKYKDQIIRSLTLLNEYINSNNFDIGEDCNDTCYSDKEEKLVKCRNIILEMIQADFE
jgi:hypothetical protein